MANLMDISPAKQGVVLATSATPFEPCRAIHVDVAGSATLTFNDGGVVAFAALPVGLFPYAIKKFTAGTATIVALY